MKLFVKICQTLFVALFSLTFLSLPAEAGGPKEEKQREYVAGELLIKLKAASTLEAQSQSAFLRFYGQFTGFGPEARIRSAIPEIKSLSKAVASSPSVSMFQMAHSTSAPSSSETEQWYVAQIDSGVANLEQFSKGLPARSSDILFAEPNYIVEAQEIIPNDPRFDELWGLHNTGQTEGTEDADMDLPEAWETTTGSRDVIVAVIDTGVDYRHPDLAENMWTNEGEIPDNGIDDDENGYIDDVYGYDFANHDGDPLDDHFHGTHVAGTIGALGNNNIGVTGVSHRVRIMAIKFLTGTGSGTTSGAIAAIRYATQQGAHITNNSWGGGGFSQALQDAINDAQNNGILTIAAAGNSNTDLPHYPSALDNVISVAATDHKDVRAHFSNYGSTVDVSAPGVDILSTFPTVETNVMKKEGLSIDYESISGTSMATPQVAGVAALVLSAFPDMSVEDLELALMTGVDQIDHLNPNFSSQLGNGRINAARALRAHEEQPIAVKVKSFDIVNGFNSTVVTRLVFQITNQGFRAEEVQAELVSTSPFASILDGATLVGDLEYQEERTLSLEVRLQEGAPENVHVEFSLMLSARNGEISNYEFALDRLHSDRTWNRELQLDRNVYRPFLADLEGDGTSEILFLMRGRLNERIPGRIYVLNSDGQFREGFPRELDGEDVVTLAAGDIDSDGAMEIVAVTAARSGNPDPRLGSLNKIYALEADGSIMAGFPIETSLSQLPNNFALTLVDMTGDGTLEIVNRHSGYDPEVGTSTSRVGVYNYRGEAVPSWPFELGALRDGSYIAAGDIDGDGRTNLIFGSSSSVREANDTASTLYAINSDGEFLNGWPTLFGHGTQHQVSRFSLADLDQDGRLEILSDSWERGPQIFSSEGERLWHGPRTSNRSFQVLPADLDRDGDLEVVFLGDHRELHAVHQDGTIVDGWPVRPRGLETMPNSGFQVVIGDTDGDGFPEVWLASIGSGVDAYKVWLNGFNHDGTPVAGFPRAYASSDIGKWPRGILLGDLDGNGEVELLSIRQETQGRGGKTHISVLDFDEPYEEAQMDWAMEFHDSRLSSRYGAPLGIRAQKPLITSQPENAEGALGQEVTFSVEANSQSPLSYQWLKNGVEILGATSSQYTHMISAEDEGILFSCLVSNEQGSTLSRDAVLSLKENQAPVIEPLEEQRTPEGVLLTLEILASDPDGAENILSYYLEEAPSGAYIDESSGSFSWVPTEEQGPGTFDIRVRVSDSGSPSLSSTMSFVVIVDEVNTAPIVSSNTEYAIDERKEFVLQIAASDTDLPTQKLSYLLLSGPPGVNLDEETGVFRWTPSEAQGPNRHGVVVVVSDDGLPAKTATAIFQLEVREVNDTAPQFESMPGELILKEGDEGGFRISASDEDDVSTLSYRILSGGRTIQAELNSNTGDFRYKVPYERGHLGAHSDRVVVEVSDGERSTSKTIEIVVADFHPYQNPSMPYDINNDGHVTPLDILVNLNCMNRPHTCIQDPANRALGALDLPPVGKFYFYDANGDDYINPVGDILPIINCLNDPECRG